MSNSDSTRAYEYASARCVCVRPGAAAGAVFLVVCSSTKRLNTRSRVPAVSKWATALANAAGVVPRIVVPGMKRTRSPAPLLSDDGGDDDDDGRADV
jgi:hypothetical protein